MKNPNFTLFHRCIITNEEIKGFQHSLNFIKINSKYKIFKMN